MSMVQKQREFPVRLKQEEALLRSLKPHHKKREKIKQNLKKIRAGYRGESELDYQLQFLPDKEYLIFQNLRFIYQNITFQMDTLILSPWYAVIIESKNIFGHLYFDPVSKQLIRTFNNEKDGFSDPILQVNRQAKQFQKWTSQYMSKSFPVHTLVSIGYPSTIVETCRGNEQIFDKVLHTEHIPQKILDLPRDQLFLSSYQLRKLTDLLLSSHTSEPSINILKHYSIFPSELNRGIPCPQCLKSSMDRVHGGWSCGWCQTKSKNVHVQMIEDYILLHGSINNEQCRDLLGLTSVHTAKQLLKVMKLRAVGKNKGTVYHLVY